MSSPDVAPPPAPDDDEYSPEPTRHDRVMAELARRTELIAADDRVIAKAQARRAEHLVTLQEWSEKDRIAAELHGAGPAPKRRKPDAPPVSVGQARAVLFARWENKEVARRTIISEVACLTRTAERTIARQLDQAQLLYYCAPATFDAVANGEISFRHATALVDQLRTVPMEDQAAFEEHVLPVAKRMPVGRFREKARRLREKLHPESIVTRNRHALADRHTRWEADYDGMGWLHWYGTAEQTKAVFDRITTMAQRLKRLGDPTSETGETGGTGVAGGADGADGADSSAADRLEAEERTLNQLRADITAALLLDGITTTGLGTGVKGTVMITVTAETLLGRSDEPAILEGYGPLSLAAARRIAGDAPGFTRLLTHPETGVILSLGTTFYKNTTAMKKWLRMRDETCRFPGCSHPAVHSDLDHTNDWAGGGTTDHDNLAHLCTNHHRLKHLSQWTVTQQPGGILLWTSPGKRTYQTDPANQMAPPPPTPPATRPRTRKKPTNNTNPTPKPQPSRPPTPPLPENPPF